MQDDSGSQAAVKLGRRGQVRALLLSAAVLPASLALIAPPALAQTTPSTTEAPYRMPVENPAQPQGTAPVAAPAVVKSATYRFSRVVVEGNQNIETGTILSYLGLKRGQTVTGGELNDAYQRIAGTGLFQSVTLTPRGSTLYVKVVEYPTIGVISFQGNHRFKDDELKKIIKSTAHRVFSPAQAEADAQQLATFYRAKGRYGADITPKIIKRPNNVVDLVFEIGEGKTTEIQRLSFIGNHAYSNYRLRQVLATKQAGLLHWFIQSDSYLRERIAEDRQKLTDFYQARGYIDFEILDVASQMKRNRSGFFLTFTIHEGLPFKFGKISMVSDVDGLSAKDYQSLLQIHSGATYNPAVMKRAIERVENKLAMNGVTFVQVKPVVTRNDATQTLDIAFHLERSPRVFVQRIDIQGNTTTLDRVIRRQFRTNEGDPYNPREIQAAAERLRALGYFSDVQVTTKPGTEKGKVIVDVNVKEKPTGSLTFGLSYGVDAGLGGVVSFSESNFLGRGQSFSASINTGVDNASSSISFTEPYLLGRNVSFTFDAFLNRQSYSSTYYDSQVLGLQPSISFPVSPNGRLALRYRIAQNKMWNVDSSAATPSAVLTSEEGKRISSSLGYTYSYDTRRTGLDPKTGYVLSFGQDFAGLGGDTKYVKTEASFKAQTLAMNEQVTLRATVEGGLLNMISGSSTVLDRYSGFNVVRGFKAWGYGPRDLSASNQDALGGNKFAAVKLEADFPLGLPAEYGISGGLFWDMGSVWGLNSSERALLTTASDDTAKFHLRSVIGFSIFWTTPIGPLRFNFTKALKKESYDQERNFDLTLSTQF